MINRSLSTVAVVAVLLLVALLAPVAGAESTGVVTETVVERVDGLASDGSAPAHEGPSAFSSLDEGITSEPTAMPIPFSMVGFETAGEEVPVWFRTSVDGDDWGAFQPVSWYHEEGPDPRSAEAGGATTASMSVPVWVGEARWLQTRVAGGAAPDDVAVHLIDSSGLHRTVAKRAVDAVRTAWAGTTATASASVGRPPMIMRAQWGANESWRKGEPSYARRARAAFVHHTVNSNSYSREDAPKLVAGIYAYHTRSQGWNDIGYNFLVDRFGRIYEGRAGGVERAVIGAHAAGFNTGSFGVAVIGDFTNVTASSAAVDATAALIAWKFDVHHVDVDAPVTMTSAGGGTNRYASGTEVTLRSINGHRDTGRTACPGRLYDQLGTVRSQVAGLASPMFVDPQASPSTVLLDSDNRAGGPVTFSTRLKPSGSWSLAVRAPGGGVVQRASGSGTSASSTWRPATLEPGRYTYEFTANGRRPATGTVQARSSVLERVGASNDPVAGAIDISRTAFGDADSADHAVVARADVFADAMAGGPLAGTTGPLLLTGSDGLDARVRTELERVVPAGGNVYVLGGTQALAPAVADDLARTWSVERIGGAERTATAAAVATHVRERSGTNTVMLARSAPDDVQPWADALAGGAYGAKAGVPVLLTPSNQLTPATREALRGVERTFVLGGTLAISDEVMAEVPHPVRVRGADRSGTAAAVAERLWGRTRGAEGDKLILGGGYRPAAWTMTLAAAPLAARNDAPLLLANSGTLPPGTRDYLSRLSYGAGRQASGWTVGGQAVVGDDVVDEAARLLQ